MYRVARPAQIRALRCRAESSDWKSSKITGADSLNLRWQALLVNESQRRIMDNRKGSPSLLQSSWRDDLNIAFRKSF